MLRARKPWSANCELKQCNFRGWKCLIHGFCTSRFSPSLIHWLCAFFASNSRFMRLFQAALDTSLDSPLLCLPLSSRFALHGLRTFDQTLTAFSFMSAKKVTRIGISLSGIFRVHQELNQYRPVLLFLDVFVSLLFSLVARRCEFSNCAILSLSSIALCFHVSRAIALYPPPPRPA